MNSDSSPWLWCLKCQKRYPPAVESHAPDVCPNCLATGHDGILQCNKCHHLFPEGTNHECLPGGPKIPLTKPIHVPMQPSSGCICTACAVSYTGRTHCDCGRTLVTAFEVAQQEYLFLVEPWPESLTHYRVEWKWKESVYQAMIDEAWGQRGVIWDATTLRTLGNDWQPHRLHFDCATKRVAFNAVARLRRQFPGKSFRFRPFSTV